MVAYLLRIWWSKSPTSGKRTPFLRRLTWWRRFADFFPVTLVKTAHLPPDGKYVIGYHPHGIISVGAFSAFCTDGIRAIDLTQNDDKPETHEESKRGWQSLFPGVDRRLVTLPINFYVPFLREYFLSLGLLNSSVKSFRNVLSKSGNAVAVVVGGADEAQLTEPHTMRLVLNKRKGFVREALIAGAALVPTLAFGENDLYAVMSFPDGHIVQRLQAFVLRNFGFSVPLFRGRSVFCYDFGFLPTREPVTVVVGAPLTLPTVDAASFRPKWDESNLPMNKDAEIVDHWHSRYLDELRLISKQHKVAEWNVPGQAMAVRQQSVQIQK